MAATPLCSCGTALEPAGSAGQAVRCSHCDQPCLTAPDACTRCSRIAVKR